MTLTASIEIKRLFEVNVPSDMVFDVLADVPKSVSHFPKVDQLVDLGKNTFRWEMQKIGVDKYFLQTVYACKYTDNRKAGWVRWEPVKDVGNSLVAGRWKITSLAKDRTRIELETTGEMTLPLPAILKALFAPVVKREFQKMVDIYIANLKKTFTPA